MVSEDATPSQRADAEAMLRRRVAASATPLADAMKHTIATLDHIGVQTKPVPPTGSMPSPKAHEETSEQHSEEHTPEQLSDRHSEGSESTPEWLRTASVRLALEGDLFSPSATTTASASTPSSASPKDVLSPTGHAWAQAGLEAPAAAKAMPSTPAAATSLALDFIVATPSIAMGRLPAAVPATSPSFWNSFNSLGKDLSDSANAFGSLLVAPFAYVMEAAAPREVKAKKEAEAAAAAARLEAAKAKAEAAKLVAQMEVMQAKMAAAKKEAAARVAKKQAEAQAQATDAAAADEAARLEAEEVTSRRAAEAEEARQAAERRAERAIQEMCEAKAVAAAAREQVEREAESRAEEAILEAEAWAEARAAVAIEDAESKASLAMAQLARASLAEAALNPDLRPVAAALTAAAAPPGGSRADGDGEAAALDRLERISSRVARIKSEREARKAAALPEARAHGVEAPQREALRWLLELERESALHASPPKLPRTPPKLPTHTPPRGPARRSGGSARALRPVALASLGDFNSPDRERRRSAAMKREDYYHYSPAKAAAATERPQKTRRASWAPLRRFVRVPRKKVKVKTPTVQRLVPRGDVSWL